VRRIPFLAALAVLMLALAACGGSKKPTGVKITLGRGGGLAPFAITIAPDGKVTAAGATPVKPPAALTSAQDDEVSRLVRDGFGKLKSIQCAGTFPDEATFYITALGKTVSVRGACEPGFTKLWDSVTNALGLNQ